MLLLANDLVERVSQIIPRYSMLTPGDRVGVAVSGGADSVVLLHVLHRLVGRLAIRLMALHVNHGLRGAESDEDEQFVRDLARSLGLECAITRATPGPGNLEQEARRVRREFFQKCRERHGLQKVALGHTRSDQAETVLYRFLRGSGIAGLAGMRPVTADGFVRPLLQTSREEVRSWAEAGRIAWREDSSNLNQGFVRNRLRTNVLPALASEFNPNLEHVLAGSADIAAVEEEYWDSLIDPLYRNLFKKCALGLLLDVKALNRFHRAIQRRLIRRAIADMRGDLRSIDLQHTDAILNVSQSEHGHDRVLIPGVDAIRSFNVLLLTKPGELSSAPRNYSIEVSLGCKQVLPYGAGTLELRVLNSTHNNCVSVKKESQFPKKEVADLDLGALTRGSTGTRLQVRNWRPGDEMVRTGHDKPEKIKSLFQQFRILLWKRRHWPVAVVNDEVFWVRGFGAASPYLAHSGSQAVARLCYCPGEEVHELGGSSALEL
jgi:tRNA(Ile)-lysidine synthase